MTTQQIDYATRAQQYVALRAKKKEIQDRHKVELQPINDILDKLEGLFLDFLNNTGQDSAKTPGGTFYRTTRNTASLEDPAEFMRHVIGTESWDLLDKKANVSAVKDFLETHKVLPPGVKFTSDYTVGVRAPAKKA